MLCCGWLGGGLEGTANGEWQAQRRLGKGKGPEVEVRGPRPSRNGRRSMIRRLEARIPGHNGAAQKQEKTWSGLAANITAWNSSGLAWAVHEKDDFILLQETRLSRKQFRGAKSAATKQGFDA
eukprot:3556071-Heterocapsa_arctica.AAC.1